MMRFPAARGSTAFVVWSLVDWIPNSQLSTFVKQAWFDIQKNPIPTGMMQV